MSISCEAYVGFTVTLKTNLKEEDYDFFNEAEDIDFPDRVQLIVDGMCGHYARLIYVDENFDCWVDDREYYPLKSLTVTDEIYDKLNQVYKQMYNKDLDRESIEYALSFHFY
jgi:hypothetical protein